MFDAETRKANQENLRGFGDAFAGRGQAVGRTVEELPRLLEHLQPVMSNLADPDTELTRFFDELADAARIVAPVSEQQAALFTSMADTFEALGRDEGALKQTISDSPPTMDVAIESFRVQRPFLANLEGFGDDFAPATAELRGALPTLNRAVEVAIPVNKRAPDLNEELGKTLDQLRELSEAPGTLPGVRGLGATVTTLNPQMKFYGPYVTVCNSPNLFFTYLAEHFSEPDTTGSAQRALAQHGRPAGRRRRLDGRRRARQRPEREGGRAAVRAEPAVRGGDHARRARRLRDRSARLAGAQRRRPGRQVPREPQPAHARRAGPDVRRQAARAQGPDVRRGARDQRLPAAGALRSPSRGSDEAPPSG